MILFPLDSKVAIYFIQFAKYQNWIYWGNCLLHKVIKNAIPTKISEKLHYTKKDLSTFEGLKKAILKIDRDYWRKISDDNYRKRTVHTL